MYGPNRSPQRAKGKAHSLFDLVNTLIKYGLSQAQGQCPTVGTGDLLPYHYPSINWYPPDTVTHSLHDICIQPIFPHLVSNNDTRDKRQKAEVYRASGSELGWEAPREPPSVEQGLSSSEKDLWVGGSSVTRQWWPEGMVPRCDLGEDNLMRGEGEQRGHKIKGAQFY